MCVLLFQDLNTDKPLEKDMFKRMWSQNPHGAGVGYWRQHEPVILTTMNENTAWENYLKAVIELKEQPGSKQKPKNLIVHCRVATHGTPKIQSNNHPFFVPAAETPFILGHNGSTKHEGVIRPQDWSDTRTLAESWIPEHAPNLLFRDEHIKKLREQIGDSRVVICTPWTHRFWNFPEQMKKYAEYGAFSNFLWAFDKSCSTVKDVTKNFYSGHSDEKLMEGNWVPYFKEDFIQKDRDFKRHTNFPLTDYLSDNMAARAMMYAVSRNLSFAATMLMFKDIFRAWPGIQDMKQFTDNFEELLEEIALWYDEPLPLGWKELWDQKWCETDKDLKQEWVDFCGIKHTEAEEADSKETIQEELGQLALENEKANHEEGEWDGEGGAILSQKKIEAKENFPVDENFPYDDQNQDINSQPVLGFGHQDDLGQWGG